MNNNQNTSENIRTESGEGRIAGQINKFGQQFDKEHLMHNIRDYQQQAMQGGRRALDSAGSFVRNRPYVAIGIAAVGGYLLSSLIFPRRRGFSQSGSEDFSRRFNHS